MLLTRLSLGAQAKEFHEFHPIGGLAAMVADAGAVRTATCCVDVATGVARADGAATPVAAAAPTTAVHRANRILRLLYMGRLRAFGRADQAGAAALIATVVDYDQSQISYAESLSPDSPEPASRRVQGG